MVPIGPTMSKQWGEGTVVVPAPREVDIIMKSVPEGKLITIQEIRDPREAPRCHDRLPLTTGIFAWIAAHAAQDDLDSKRRDVTPYWRTLKSGGYLNEKYPGGVEAHERSSKPRVTRWSRTVNDLRSKTTKARSRSPKPAVDEYFGRVRESDFRATAPDLVLASTSPYRAVRIC